jgi:hypothetical protein
MGPLNMKYHHTSILRFILAIVLLAVLPVQHVMAERTEAGKVIYAHGTVWAADADNKGRVLKKGDILYSGDTIITKSSSMAHIRMVDKGYVSVRADSRFRIKEFRLGKDRDEDVGFFELLKGGFRAITGIIGKRNKSSYLVNTSIATIGIRGTDYTARLCNDDCGTSVASGGSPGVVENGLYVGVLDGGVVLANQMGQLELQRLHYGFVKDAGSAPRALLDAPKFLFFKSKSPRIRDDDDEGKDTGAEGSVELQERAAIVPPGDDALSAERQNADIGEITGELDQDQIDSQTSFDRATSDGGDLNNPSEQATRPVAMATGPLQDASGFTTINNNTEAELAVDADGSVEGFSAQTPAGVVSQYAIGTAQNVDLGLDEATGIRWGRWANGVASVGDQNLDLNDNSLHWVSGPSVLNNIALPSSGTASYNLVGNTTPTDNLGNTGILGNATLQADFNNMTVDSSVSVGINDRVWQGSSTGMPIDASGHYNGAMNVNVTDLEQSTVTGSGTTNGFFTNNAAGSGMTYSMDANIDGTPNNVSGAAVFQKQ